MCLASLGGSVLIPVSESQGGRLEPVAMVSEVGELRPEKPPWSLTSWGFGGRSMGLEVPLVEGPCSREAPKIARMLNS